MIDTHSHLNFAAFQEDWEQVVDKAEKDGISKIIIVGTDIETSKKAIDMAQTRASLFAAVGIHPHHVKSIKNQTEVKSLVEEISKLAMHPKVVAIGEIGIDHHEYKNSKYDTSSYEIQAYNALQTSVFSSQLELSISIDKPVIIHSRDAKNEALDYVLETNTRTKKNIRGVFHCYEGSKKMVEHILAAGLYISFTANITYVPDRLDVATLVPLDKLLLETDCPYMSPISIRGKRNSPSSATMIAAAHAQSRNITISQIEAQTDKNAHTLFGLD